MTEEEYINITDIAHRKKYAQFFTPEPIAEFMGEWVLDGLPDTARILEPAFGLGVFSRVMTKRHPGIRIVGYDVDERIIKYAKGNFNNVENGPILKKRNYITSSWRDKYDGIICNPPYMKFHDYDNGTFVSYVNERLHTNLNGFTNLYTLFLLKSISQLKAGGRLAYIIPSEFLNSDYGIEVKRVLLESGVLRHVVVVDFTRSAFDDAITTACILLCSRSVDSDIIRFSNVSKIDNLSFSLTDYTEYRRDKLRADVKWKQYYEGQKASCYRSLVPFSTFARVTRGIATGANDYFTFRQSKIRSFDLPEHCFRPCICHSIDVKSLIFSEDDFNALVQADKTVFLFDGKSVKGDDRIGSYIKYGELTGIDKKYLTSCRKPWFAIENRLPAPIWVSVFNRSGLRFVRNKAGVYNLTTFHCVYDTGVVDADILFGYLVTDMAKEIFMDNSRQYGNGLVKFEPNDLNNGYVADLRQLSLPERRFVRDTVRQLQDSDSPIEKYLSVLDRFFRERFSSDRNPEVT